MGLRNLVVDRPGSLGARARARRWDLFAEFFPNVADLSVLDLGGTPSTWLRAPIRPASVTVLNLFQDQFSLRDGQRDLPDGMELLNGDACEPPEDLTGRDFDLVFSNSLIEHVGGSHRRRQLADVVQRMADRHWIQTPYRYFPIEPHWIFPGFQFLPLQARGWLSQTWPLLHSNARTKADGIDAALDVELLSITEMRHLFPTGDVHFERFAGLPKSLVAVRH